MNKKFNANLVSIGKVFIFNLKTNKLYTLPTVKKQSKEQLIYSSFESEISEQVSTYKLSQPLYQPYNGLEEATYDPEWNNRLKNRHKLNGLLEKVGWNRSDLITHLATQHNVTENADEEIIKDALQWVTKDLDWYVSHATDPNSVKLIGRSEINKQFNYWKGKGFNEQQQKQLDRKLKELNKEISGLDPSKAIPKPNSKDLKVKLTVGNKFWMNLKDILYKITQETGDQRPTVMAEELDMGRRKYDLEANVVNELMKNLKEHITSKEIDVLVSNYLQKIGNYREMSKPEHKELRDAVDDIRVMLENTKGVIAVSRVYDAISGAVSLIQRSSTPNTRKNK